MKKFAIVIPLYKTADKLDRLEQLNFDRFCKFLNRDSKTYDIICLTYSDEIYDSYNDKYKLFNRCYKIQQQSLDNVAVYSLFMCTETLWEGLYRNGYDYMYLMQTDVVILKDEFEKWIDYCRENKIDYIGGPIVSWHDAWGITPSTVEEAKHLPAITKCKVGNGGFCLRNVKTMYEVTSSNKEFFKTYIETGQDEPKYNMLIKKIMSYKHSYMEDMYFCLFVAHRYPLKLASVEDALKFSWDYNPDRCYELNNHELPMALHAPHNSMRFFKQSHIVDVWDKEDWIDEEQIKKWEQNFRNKLNNEYKIMLIQQ